LKKVKGTAALVLVLVVVLLVVKKKQKFRERQRRRLKLSGNRSLTLMMDLRQRTKEGRGKRDQSTNENESIDRHDRLPLTLILESSETTTDHHMLAQLSKSQDLEITIRPPFPNNDLLKRHQQM
jgi:hypothetical protein